MPRRVVMHNQVNYTITPDDAVPVTDRFQAIVKARLKDEITDNAPVAQARITNIVPGLVPKYVPNGLIGCSGIPASLFPLLSLQNYPVSFDIEVPGYLPLSFQSIIGPQPTFPASFTPLEVPDEDLVLHREPVVICGRVMEGNEVTIAPLSSAEVMITGIWRLQSDPDGMTPPEDMMMLYTLPSLYFDHAAGSATVESSNIERTVNDKVLTDIALAGTRQIELSDRNHIGTGYRIAIHDADPARTEYRTIQSPAPDPTRGAGLVDLTRPLEFEHPIDSLVEILPPVLLDYAYAGSNELHLSERINIGAGDIIVIDEDDEYKAEYITIAAPPATADRGPGPVTLVHPLAYNHNINTTVRRVDKQLTATTRQIARDAITRDSSLFLNNALTPTAVRFVEIATGMGPTEIHAIRHYSTMTDTAGYFRLPPIHRVAEVVIEVREGTRTASKNLPLDYNNRENRIDFKLEIP